MFKVFTSAMALDTGTVPLSRQVRRHRQAFRSGGYRIDDDHAKTALALGARDLQYSSNIGTARMAFAAGGAKAMLEAFFERWASSSSRHRDAEAVLGGPQVPKRWPDITVATASFGHGIAVTPLQYVDAAWRAGRRRHARGRADPAASASRATSPPA